MRVIVAAGFGSLLICSYISFCSSPKKQLFSAVPPPSISATRQDVQHPSLHAQPALLVLTPGRAAPTEPARGSGAAVFACAVCLGALWGRLRPPAAAAAIAGREGRNDAPCVMLRFRPRSILKGSGGTYATRVPLPQRMIDFVVRNVVGVFFYLQARAALVSRPRKYSHIRCACGRGPRGTHVTRVRTHECCAIRPADASA